MAAKLAAAEKLFAGAANKGILQKVIYKPAHNSSGRSERLEATNLRLNADQSQLIGN